MSTQDGATVEPYDILVLAAGAVTSYFGDTAIERFSFDIKSLEGSLELRNHVLRQFEAAWADDPRVRRAMTAMVVVGGGATGIEMAGSLFGAVQLRVQTRVPTNRRSRTADYPDRGV
ncbi:MAG: FAD-dependent oxidoreductase [Chloroflexi bacterium]|nr:FAD-dependent oxidoreductase [Chloroflexota bacterium]